MAHRSVADCRTLEKRTFADFGEGVTAAGRIFQKKRQSIRAIGALLIEPVLACVIVGSLLTAMITRLITLRPQILSDAPPGGFASPFSLRASKEDTGSSAWPLPA